MIAVKQDNLINNNSSNIHNKNNNSKMQDNLNNQVDLQHHLTLDYIFIIFLLILNCLNIFIKFQPFFMLRSIS